MDKKLNLYVVLTEYQFLQALNIATNIYFSQEFINKIYIIRSGKRLSGIVAEKDWSLENTQIIILDQKSPKEITTTILKENPVHFFIFQGLSAINVYLSHLFSKKGVEVSLGPDGYGTYAIYKMKYPLLSLLKNTIKENLFLVKNKLFSGRIYLFDFYKYGSCRYIDNIWVSHPDKYIHQARNKVNVIKLPNFNEKCIAFIGKCFDFNEDFPVENVIYYFNQPLLPELIEKEFSFLNGVLEHFFDKKIITKLHPLTSEETKEKYKSLDRVQIIESTVPAEVLLLSLRNCIVFTGWSSVLITENDTCNYYFNYPIYKDINLKFLKQSDLVILEHINLVTNPKLMQFPNE